MMACLGYHFMAVAFIAIGYITLYLELLASMQLTCMHDCVDTNQFTYFIYLGMWGGNEWENHVSPGRDECICDAVMLTTT